MSCQAPEVEAFLAGGQVLQTRLRERSTGDVHDIPSIPPVIPGISGRPEDVVALLEALEKQGIVVRTETVHANDSAEYRVIWRIAGSR